jgi:hypothetical protein
MKRHSDSHQGNPVNHLRTTPCRRRLCLALAAGATLLALAPAGRAQAPAPTSSYTNTFDDAASVASWIYWYGLGFNNTQMTWDGTMDAEGNTNSGSLMVSMPFTNSGDQAVWFGTFDNKSGYDNALTYDGSKFTNITVKIHVQPGTALDASGDFGLLQFGLVDHNWSHGGTFYGNGQTIPAAATNGWVTLVQPVDLTDPLLGSPGSSGVDFKYTSYGGYPTNPVTFWLDDLTVNLAPTNTKILPPTLSAPYRATPGLNVFSSTANGGVNQRTDIGLINSGTGNTWLGAAGSVTYSISITNFPPPAVGANGAYQAQIFLTSGNFPLPTYEAAPDYNETNLVFFEIDETTTGAGYCSFRYKINEPNSNANVYGTDNGTAGTLVTMNAPAVLGTWSITFNNDTNVTMSGPGGAVTNFVFTNAVAVTGGVQNFGDPINVFFGAQANSTAAIGSAVVLSGVSITGNGNPVSDDFMTDTPPLNPQWGVYANDPSTVQLLTADPAAWWVKWTLPDAGFGLQTTSNLFGPHTWVALTGPDSTANFPTPLVTIANSGYRAAYVPGSASAGTNEAFFRLNEQTFTKLQVLMPGESSAPGTATGKTGTPDPQTAGAAFTVTVNAVDQNWTVIPTVTDTVHLTSSDTNATLDADAPLVAGTRSLLVTFSTNGTFTVTASDVTDSSKLPGTSSPTVAQ